MLPVLEKEKNVQLMGLGGIHQFQGIFRLNHAFPPFDNPAVRKVMWKLVDQDATLTAIGVPGAVSLQVVPVLLDVRHAAHHRCRCRRGKFDLAQPRPSSRRPGYKGEPVIILEVSGSISQTGLDACWCRTCATSALPSSRSRATGRRCWRGAPRRTSWSMFPVYSNGTDMYSPLTHFYVAATCNDFPGWSCDDRIPALIKTFTRAATGEERKRIAADIQAAAYDLTPSVMWGQFTIPARLPRQTSRA